MFLDMAVAHEYSHLFNPDEKEASELELQSAALLDLEKPYLSYLEEEYPKKIQEMKRWGLLKSENGLLKFRDY